MEVRRFAFVAALAVAGCASTAIPTDQARPTEEILDQVVTKPNAGTSRVQIKRDVGVVGSACGILVLLNGKPLAKLHTGQIVTAYLPPGEYIFGAASTGICGGGDSEVQVRLANDETRTLRVSVDQGTAIRIGPTAQ